MYDIVGYWKKNKIIGVSYTFARDEVETKETNYTKAHATFRWTAFVLLSGEANKLH